MNLDKVASDLKFIGSSVLELNVKNNIVSLGNTQNTINLSLDVNKVTPLGTDSINGYQGYLKLILDISIKDRKDKTAKCKFSLTMEGCFEGNIPDIDQFEKMLYVNGGTTLYSIARAQILNVSSNVFMKGKILLPLINMIEFLEEADDDKKPSSDK